MNSSIHPFIPVHLSMYTSNVPSALSSVVTLTFSRHSGRMPASQVLLRCSSSESRHGISFGRPRLVRRDRRPRRWSTSTSTGPSRSSGKRLRWRRRSRDGPFSRSPGAKAADREVRLAPAATGHDGGSVAVSGAGRPRATAGNINGLVLPISEERRRPARPKLPLRGSQRE